MKFIPKLRFHTIDAPLTYSESARSAAILLGAIVLMLASMPACALVATMFGAHIPASTQFVVGNSFLLILPVAIYLGALHNQVLPRPASSFYSPLLLKWAGQYPEVRRYLAKVHAMPRPVLMGDFQFLKAWVDVRSAEDLEAFCERSAEHLSNGEW